ncbi:DUF4185 domain-containing protein [Nocardia brasiliensis]|uniref:DUF4185 domain-containing protein n=1 Tax=Nocardia brasiliensis TaxID=37326 RepID=A0A6G9Y1G6_NOCBR|nr:DUF4185 domain-containing protein [Nocardia brasiliensis]QIS07042.1 DUF4185 domain-containing protein [Nocardia brasiliensis]
MRRPGRHPACVPAVFGVLLSGVLTTPAQAGPLPWAPAPVNSCGEVGFDPRLREPDPAQPVPPPLALPERIDIPIPVPQLVPVPVPGPPQQDVRIDAPPLGPDPCHTPCPEVRDIAREPERSEPPEQPPPGAPITVPRIGITPEIEPIPVPVPDGPAPEPTPAPPRVTPPVAPGPLAPPVAEPRVGTVELAGQVTGHGSPNRTDVRWQVDGTDLGVLWETKPGEVAVAFGDTFGKGWATGGAGGQDQDWRSNVLGYSTDRDLSDGLSLDRMVQDSRCHAAEILSSRKIKNWEITTIPTSGFALGERQYLSYMSVNRWSRIPGLWRNNYGGLAYSDDNGRTWTKDQHAKWDNVFGVGRFQVVAMVPHGEHVYMFGTPNGRLGVIGLARVSKEDVLNTSAYQYWVNGNWVPAAENQATPLVAGLAGEVSVRFDEDTEQWQMVYLDPTRGAIVLRNAAQPQGEWTEAVPLLDTADYPSSYGGFLHPWSTGRDLYFTLSTWQTYNVYLMHAQLDSPR